MAILGRKVDGTYHNIMPGCCLMVGVPSGWDRLAAWVWGDPPSYEVAVGVLIDNLADHGPNGFDNWPTAPQDDISGDYEEVGGDG